MKTKLLDLFVYKILLVIWVSRLTLAQELSRELPPKAPSGYGPPLAAHRPAYLITPAPAPYLLPSPIPKLPPPTAPLAPPIHHPAPLPDYDETPKNYAFEYAVKDHYSGDDFSHQEARNGYITTGEYRVSLPDGRVQIVSYVADENGYRADVKYEGEVQPYHAPLPSPTVRLVPDSPHHQQPPPHPVPLTPYLPKPTTHYSALPPKPIQLLPEVPDVVPVYPPTPTLKPYAPLPVKPYAIPPGTLAPAVVVEPQPVALVHDLKKLHAPIPKPGYIPTPAPRPYPYPGRHV